MPAWANVFCRAILAIVCNLLGLIKKKKKIVEFWNRGSFGSLELMNELFEVEVDDR